MAPVAAATAEEVRAVVAGTCWSARKLQAVATAAVAAWEAAAAVKEEEEQEEARAVGPPRTCANSRGLDSSQG